MEKAMEKGLELLEALARRLGTTVEQLWPVLIRQVSVEAVTFLLGFGILAAAFARTAWLFNRTRRACRSSRLESKDRHESRFMTDVEMGATVATVVGTVLAVSIAVIALTINLPKLLNPEFYALRFVSGLLGGGK